MRLAITTTPSVARFAPILHRGSVPEAFALAAELGYQGVELHLRQPEDVNRGEVIRLMGATGLSVPTLGTGMAAGEDGLTFADPNPDVRHRAVKRVKGHIALAAELGSAVTIGLIWGRVGRDAGTRSVRVGQALACLEACCTLGMQEGVRLLLEPLNRYESDYPNTLADGMEILAQIGAPNLSLLADTFHMNIEEANLATSIDAAGATIGHVHLVDSNRQAPGHGHSDLRAVIGALRGVGFDGFLSFECLPLPDARRASSGAADHVRDLLTAARPR